MTFPYAAGVRKKFFLHIFGDPLLDDNIVAVILDMFRTNSASLFGSCIRSSPHPSPMEGGMPSACLEEDTCGEPGVEDQK